MGNALDCTDGDPFLNFTGNGTAPPTPAPPPTIGGSLYFFLGLGLTIASSFVVSLGTVLQKKAHLEDLSKPLEDRAPRRAGMLLSKTWLCGFLMMVILQIPLTFGALAVAPQSLVIPLGAGSTIVITQILAILVLKEFMGRTEVVATLLIVIGVILTTTANSNPSPVMTACKILARYTEPDFFIPMIVLLVALISCTLSLHYYPRGLPKRFQPALFAFIAGSLGAILNIMLKVVGEFTSGAIAGDPMAQASWSSVHPFYHLAMIVAMAIGMISFINQGLERFSAVSFLPLYNCLFIILATLFGALFFREFDSFGVQADIMFPLGIVTAVIGIGIISCGGQEFRIEDWDGEMEGFGGMEMGGRDRGPSDPLDNGIFDGNVDISAEEKAYVSQPVTTRLVLI